MDLSRSDAKKGFAFFSRAITVGSKGHMQAITDTAQDVTAAVWAIAAAVRAAAASVGAVAVAWDIAVAVHAASYHPRRSRSAGCSCF